METGNITNFGYGKSDPILLYYMYEIRREFLFHVCGPAAVNDRNAVSYLL